MRLPWLLVILAACARSPQAQPTSTSPNTSSGPVAPDAGGLFDAGAAVVDARAPFDASLPRPMPVPMKAKAADTSR